MSTFEKMTPNQRVQAVNIDCMRHPQYALLAGVICMGKSEVVEHVPTACTNGKDKLYGLAFIMKLNRKQLRYVVLHENFHVALKHCVLPFYDDLCRKYGHKINNIAMDFVVNALIEELDPDFKFVERPSESLCINPKFFGMSYVQVLKELLKRKGGQGGKKGKADTGGNGGTEIDVDDLDDYEPLDDHVMSPEDLTADEREKLSKAIDDANRQGELMARKLRGEGKGGRDIFGHAQERQTDWRNALQEFISAICQGDENSRFCPPNKRLLASGFVMPSHFTESIGDIVIASDTSGSMHPYYPVVFGEIARVCANVKPDSVRVLWWDTSVDGDQTFLPHEYENIASIMKPVGGGGTTVSCVADYIEEHKINAKAVIYLTDGYIESDYRVPNMPVLFGVVDNENFVPHTGKVVRITV